MPRRRPPPDRPPGDRRAERSDRRLMRAPRRGLRRLPLRDRHPQADHPDLEEGGLGRRRGLDRRRGRRAGVAMFPLTLCLLQSLGRGWRYWGKLPETPAEQALVGLLAVIGLVFAALLLRPL